MGRVVWEWLVAHAAWTGAVFAIPAVLMLDRDSYDALTWLVAGLGLVLIWTPAAERMRRIFLATYRRP
jgi:hypothetical protein